MLRDVRVALRLDNAFLGIHFLHCRRQNNSERPSRSERLVCYVLRLRLGDGVKDDLDRRRRNLLHLREEGIIREVAIQDVRGALALQVVGVAQRGCGDDGTKASELRELDDYEEMA